MTNNEIVTPNEPTRSEKTKNNKRRILLIMLLLVCTLTLLGGATYAWFTANTKVAIADLDIEVTVADGIEISADARNWGIKLNYRDLLKAAGMDLNDTTGLADSKTEDAGSINVFPEKLKNVSSVGNIDTANNRLELFDGIAASACYLPGEDDNISDEIGGITTDGYGKEDGAVEISDCHPDSEIFTALVKNSKYSEPDYACAKGGTSECTSAKDSVMAFDIYLKLDNSSTVTLSPESIVKNNTEVDSGLKNTIRVAFETLGTQPSAYYNAESALIDADGKAQVGTSKDAAYETKFGGYAGYYGARQMNSFGNIVVWEPNNTFHTEFGVSNGIKNYNMKKEDITTTTSVDTHGIHTMIPTASLPLPLSKADASNTATNFAIQKTISADTDGKSVTAEDQAAGYKNPINYVATDTEYAKNGTTGIKLFTAPAGVTKVRIYIWVEGNDIDTENNATASKVLASLFFTTSGTNHDEIDAPGYDGFITAKYGNSLAASWRNNTDESIKTPIKGTYGQVPTETETATEPAVTP